MRDPLRETLLFLLGAVLVVGAILFLTTDHTHTEPQPAERMCVQYPLPDRGLPGCEGSAV